MAAATAPVLTWKACQNPAQVRRPCTAFEFNPAVCLCPGKGHRVEFALDIIETWIPNVPGEWVAAADLGDDRIVSFARFDISSVGAPTKNRQLLTFNGTSPGPNLVVTEGDWVVIKIRNRLTIDVHYSSIAVRRRACSPPHSGSVSSCLLLPTPSCRCTGTASTRL